MRTPAPEAAPRVQYKDMDTEEPHSDDDEDMNTSNDRYYDIDLSKNPPTPTVPYEWMYEEQKTVEQPFEEPVQETVPAHDVFDIQTDAIFPEILPVPMDSSDTVFLMDIQLPCIPLSVSPLYPNLKTGETVSTATETFMSPFV